MKIKIDLKKWYAKGNIALFRELNYFPRLLNSDDERCCLGFACEAYGVPKSSLLGKGSPGSVYNKLPTNNWMLSEDDNTQLTLLAITLNDALRDEDTRINWGTQPLEVRMGNLITVFLEGGDELVFEN